MAGGITDTGARKFTRIPPESTGDRMYMIHTAEIPFDGKDGYDSARGTTHTWSIGSRYSIAGFGIVHVHGVYDKGDGTGILAVHYDQSSKMENLTPSDNAIISLDGDNIAVVNGVAYDVMIPAQNIMGYDNPEYGWNIDRFGSGQLTFAEGAPQLDAFGKLRTSGATVLGEYIFANNILPASFSTRKVGSATATWDSSAHALLLTNSTASGDLVAHTSNTYHHYVPGSSHSFMGTVQMSAGQSGLSRYWGLFDFQDGFMFCQVDGVFGVQIRSNVTGSVVNTFIPQSSFNKDTCDGSRSTSNPSGFNIDLTKDNIYWLDAQWLGAGRVRFGCYSSEGERIVMHSVEHANSSSRSITTTASLPVCYVQRNTTGIGSTAEFRAFCSAVYTEVSIDVQSLGRTALATFEKTIPSGSPTSNYVYIGTLSPEVEISSGNINRSLYWPTAIDVMAYDSDGNDARIELEVYAEPVLSGLSFSPIEAANPINTVEEDTSATYYGGGAHLYATYVKGSIRTDLLQPDDSMSVGAFKNYAETGGTRQCNISNITAASPAVITVEHPYHIHREGEPQVIDNIVGTMSSINGDTVYLKINGANTAELYTDEALTIPVNTTSLTYTSGGTLTGNFGTRLHYTILAKPLTPSSVSPAQTTKDITVHVMLSWKEISQ